MMFSLGNNPLFKIFSHYLSVVLGFGFEYRKKIMFYDCWKILPTHRTTAGLFLVDYFYSYDDVIPC
jgi:hypothetical protein